MECLSPQQDFALVFLKNISWIVEHLDGSFLTATRLKALKPLSFQVIHVDGSGGTHLCPPTQWMLFMFCNSYREGLLSCLLESHFSLQNDWCMKHVGNWRNHSAYTSHIPGVSALGGTPPVCRPTTPMLATFHVLEGASAASSAPTRNSSDYWKSRRLQSCLAS